MATSCFLFGRSTRGPKPPARVSEHAKEYVHFLRASFRDEKDDEREQVRYGSSVAVALRVPGKPESTGLFVTAAHNVVPQKRLKQVVLVIGETDVRARVEVVDEASDCALLTVPAYKGGAIPLAREEPTADARVLIFGFPVKYSGTALPELVGTGGVVADPRHRHRMPSGGEMPVLEIQGSTHFGGSGGAVVDEKGEHLVGMVFAARFLEDSTTGVFALPASRLAEHVNNHFGKK